MDTEPEALGKESWAELASEDRKDSPGWGSGWPGEPILGFLELRKVGCTAELTWRALLINWLKSPQ